MASEGRRDGSVQVRMYHVVSYRILLHIVCSMEEEKGAFLSFSG
jgi:hypothetical protein